MGSIDNLISAYEVKTFDPHEVLGHSVSVQSIPPAYKQAIKDAATKHFGSSTGGRVIWCMGMTPRVLLGEEIGLPPQDETGQTRHLVRNSDDYYPDVNDSHRYHIYTNAVNALFTSHLNVIPDFDMVSGPRVVPSGTL